MNHNNSLSGKTALITGAAHRIGAQLARQLHETGMNIALHYRHSKSAAEELAAELNQQRKDSVITIQGDLLDTEILPQIIKQAASHWQGLDVLINNASSFFPTEVGGSTEEEWNDLIGSNLKAPFFLAQAATPYLQKQQGCIINIIDIHAERPLKGHPIYSIAKAGLAMMTKSLARELGPDIRVNGIAPGAILWPELEMDESNKQEIIERTALKRQGSPEDIARTALFLIRDAEYISGQIISVDGGRTLSH
jgi:pteridine reductase